MRFQMIGDNRYNLCLLEKNGTAIVVFIQFLKYRLNYNWFRELFLSITFFNSNYSWSKKIWERDTSSELGKKGKKYLSVHLFLGVYYQRCKSAIKIYTVHFSNFSVILCCFLLLNTDLSSWISESWLWEKSINCSYGAKNSIHNCLSYMVMMLANNLHNGSMKSPDIVLLSSPD